MSEKKIALSPYATLRYNVSGEVSFDVGMNYLGALITIASADGELDSKELNWLLAEQKMLGAPEELLEKIRNFDWRNTNVETLIESLHYDFPMDTRNTMLYQAIKMSSADGEYHEKERAAIWKIAQALKVDDASVHAIESLVRMENACDKLRYALLGTMTEKPI